MNMLDRIKKRQIEGFKDFVQNLETTASQGRQQILMTGILEDPLYMGHVLKNIKTFEQFLDLPTDELEKVLNQNDQNINLFAKCFAGNSPEEIECLAKLIPHFYSKIKDELSYGKEVSPAEKESAVFFILKIVRKLQEQELIQGFRWQLPPMTIYHPKTYPDGPLEITFETGVTAAVGKIEKGRRTGPWRHFFDTGKLLAEGEYFDGLKRGPWSIFYANGSIKAQGKYKADFKHGIWKEWNKENFLVEVEYVEGAKKT